MESWKQLFSNLFPAAAAPRTAKAGRNIIGLLILRILGIGTNLLLVPMTLTYLGQTGYGVWLTLGSIITWIGFLDIGLGNGLRNKLAEAIASSEIDRAREYVSTTYVIVGGIAAAFALLFAALNPFLPWSAILNSPSSMEPELRALALAVVLFFSLRLLFQLISSILVAHQRPAISSALDVLVGVLSLIAVAILRSTTSGSLLVLGVSVSAISALVPLAANLYFFSGKYRRYRPAFRAVSFVHSRGLMGLGARFFVLQIVGLILFASPNLLITQFFGPAEVTPYNIAMKYFGVASMLFLIVLAPFWSAYTDAYVRGDLGWIRHTLTRLRALWVLCSFGVGTMLILAGWVYPRWIGSDVQIPFVLSASVALYVMIFTWASIDVNLLNGVGKIQLQLWNGICIALAVIPLSWVLSVRLGWGSPGVVLAGCAVLLPGCVLWPLQTKRLLSGTARGIWAR